ncbi:MAG: LytTR family DNA-binding domain-containing protein [Anaerovoracaceae bacterium]
MWNIAICDDDKMTLEYLENALTDTFSPQVKRVGTFTCGESLLSALEYDHILIDILLMDIELGSDSGINVAKKILDILPNVQIVFISANDIYFTDVYEVEHVFFLTKPIDPNMLHKAILCAGKKVDELANNFFEVTNKQGTYVLPMQSILYFEKDNRIIYIKTVTTTYQFYGKFEEIENKLNDDFLRCHNSYMINLSKIASFEKGHFIMSDNKKIPVSRSYQQEVKNKFAAYLEKRY